MSRPATMARSLSVPLTSLTGEREDADGQSDVAPGDDGALAVGAADAALEPRDDDADRQDEDIEDDEADESPDVQLAAREAVAVVVLAANAAEHTTSKWFEFKGCE